MTRWPKPYLTALEVDDNSNNKVKKLFMGNRDAAQQSLLNPSRLSLGKIWKGFDQLIRSSSEFLLLINPGRNFPEATKLEIGFLKGDQKLIVCIYRILCIKHQLRTEKPFSKP
jgi:hypothetical protein